MELTIKTFDQASAAAAALSSEQSARIMGGGTLMMRGINHRSQSASTIIRVTDMALRQIKPSGGRIEIGAAATMADILANRELDFLHSAARSVGGPAVRNMATVAGNLFARSPFGDLATALLALDATVVTAGGHGGGADMPLQDFLSQRDRRGAGLITGIVIDRPMSASAFRFAKVSRVKPKGAAVITIAAYLPNSGGRIQGARIAYGAMAPTPIRVTAVERALEGQTLDPAGIQAAVNAATEGCMPATDEIASEWYRKEVAPVYLRRLLLGELG